MTKPDGIELALLHALRYEEETFKNIDTQERWGITQKEAKTVLKWMNARMKDIKDRIDG